MGLLNKYYASLKQASDYLENVKRLYNRQVEAHDTFIKRLENIPRNEEESLRECNVALKREKRFQSIVLAFCFVLDNALTWAIFAFIGTIFSLGIPLFIPFIVAVFAFCLLHVEDIRSFSSIKNMKKMVGEANTLLGSEKLDKTLVDLIQELEESIKNNEAYIEDFKQAIDEYMSLILAQESKLLPYGPEMMEDEEINVLEEGLRKLNLQYKEEDKHE